MLSERDARAYGQDCERERTGPDIERYGASQWKAKPADQIEQAISRAAVQAGLTLGSVQWDTFCGLVCREVLATPFCGRMLRRRRIGEMDTTL